MIDILKQKRIQVIRITILITVVMLGLVDISRAADIEFGLEGIAIASDNIDRGPVGDETEGFLLSTEGVLKLSSNVGAARLGLTISGGWETKEADVGSYSNNYHVNLLARVPWSGTGFVEGTYANSEGTAEPDLDDISQVRVRSRTSEAGLEVGRQASPRREWSTKLSQRSEDRFDRDFNESDAKIGWELKLDPRRTLLIEVDARTGTEKVEKKEWTGSSALLDLRRRTSSSAIAGYRLAWEGLNVEVDSGSSNWTDNLTLLFHYEMKTRKGWSYSTDLGGDGIKVAAGERLWEPHASFDLASDEEKRLRLTTSLSVSSGVQDPIEEQFSWTRSSQGRVALVWSRSRKVFIEPSVRYLYSELFGGDTAADRTDEATVLGVEAKWIPRRNWSVVATAYTEERNSSDGTFDLAEERFELRLSGLFN